jgi:hypothetical protein
MKTQPLDESPNVLHPEITTLLSKGCRPIPQLFGAQNHHLMIRR